MTDITVLAQSLKVAAEKATPGQWVAFTHADSQTFSVHTPDDKRCGDVIKWAGFDGQRKAKANAEFIALANPVNVKQLVEALEKAQQRIGRLEKKLTDRKRMNQEMAKAMLTPNDSDAAGMEISVLRQRIAELESRTVKLPAACADDEYFNDGVFQPMRYERDVERALRAAGIKVEAE